MWITAVRPLHVNKRTELLDAWRMYGVRRRETDARNHGSGKSERKQQAKPERV